MNKKNILIATYHFHPEITPRAFRAFELAKELARQGHKVTIIIPDNNYDYSQLIHNYNFSIIKVKKGVLFNKKKKKQFGTEKNNKKNNKKIYNLLVNIYLYFHPNGPKFEYFWPLFKYIFKEKKTYDLTISIAMPVSTHLGVALGRIFNKKFTRIAVADYGDPFSFSNRTKTHFRYLEKFWLRYFDHVTVPIPNAIDAFNYFKIRDKIKIIPQGFEMKEIELPEYKAHPIPHFAYAGIFYEDIRNPKNFFEFLTKIEKDFRFIIYTKPGMLNFLQPYINALGDKIIIHPFIPRDECIKELSTYDFLINVQNLHSVQSPSKLIDYALTKRPVFSFSQDDLDKDLFIQFLDGNYSYDIIKKIDINEYDIINVASRFINLSSQSNINTKENA